MRLPSAVLLVGPTGSGKTPLGNYIAANGLWRHRCAHFDFGSQLRAAVLGTHRELSEDDIRVIRISLQTGSLLEDSEFHIAEKILESFFIRHGVRGDNLVVLDGLPRHVGQARAVDRILRMRAIISLECTAEVVYDRIRRNAGGDRAGRVDDDVQAIARKLEIFQQRTAPLIQHYGSIGLPIHRVSINASTRAEDVVTHLANQTVQLS